MEHPGITRRQILHLILGSPLIAAAGRVEGGQRSSPGLLDRQAIEAAPSAVITGSGAAAGKEIELLRQWNGALCRSRLTNRGRQTANIKQVVLFDLPLDLSPATRIYGEGFQMLSQTGGTLGEPLDYGSYTDLKHYRMPIPAGARAFYGLMTLTPPEGDPMMLAFTSCRRFSGQFLLREGSLQVVIDTEGLELQPGESWELEEFTFRAEADREQLLAKLSDRIRANHRPLTLSAPPTGWCSWYCFGPRVTAEQVLENLDFIAKQIPGLKYIQIDDGYQPAMGDWLETGAAFGGEVQRVLKEIRRRGFEPAIWVAPFIAEEKSRLFAAHPDWFVKDGEGRPLRSDRVTFGGWRRGPWYALDGTHPEVARHFENLFRVMRRDWGCTYFKLDANFWGAIHGGRFHDRRATRILAYRQGMEAIVRGAGESFILGCNHPIWPSFGLVHGSRSSNDIKRSWDRFKRTARENLSRNWQNGRLWWNDPDAVVLTGDLDEEEYRFHATAIFASGGMVLSGDDLTKISPERLSMLRKLQPPTGVAARFTDDSLRVGFIKAKDRQLVCILNWEETPQSISFTPPPGAQLEDYWSGETLGRAAGTYTLRDMPPHSARLILCA